MTRRDSPKRSRGKSEILAENVRCIYCPAPATTIEHMPSRSMFRRKQRPGGFEYACCEPCNFETRAADAMAAFASRIDKLGGDEPWQLKETYKYGMTLHSLMPAVMDEMFGDQAKDRTVDLRLPSGVLIPDLAEVEVGPTGRALLNVWSAKLAMALFREHTGNPLPLNGAVFAMWFLNNGLNDETLARFLSILPGYNLLQQGKKKHSGGQFEYRFSSDARSIVGALSRFRGNLHVFSVATEEPDKLELPKPARPASVLARPGELRRMMPKPPPAILRSIVTPSGLVLPPGWRPEKRTAGSG